MSNAPILVVEGVNKSYKDYASLLHRIAVWMGFSVRPSAEHRVLENISFSVQRGEIVGIVGRNGAGKSTILKIITGTTSPSSGSVQMHGRINAILELGIGFNPELTGRQNVMFAGGMLGLSVDELDNYLPSIEAFADIGVYFDQALRTYSSGMQARLAFSLATVSTPELLIVDEVLSVGDASFQAKCFRRLEELKQKGCTILFVTHSVSQIVQHCTRALLIEGGRVLLDSDPRTVSNHYLELLFGKKSDDQTEPVTASDDSLPAQVIGQELSMADDVYHLRFGYSPTEHRWGSGAAKILDYHFTVGGESFPGVVEAGSELKIYASVKFLTNVDDAIFGILIKNPEGQFLYGINCKTDNPLAEKIPAVIGDVRKYCFRVPFNLAAGQYLVSLGISSQDDPTQEMIPLDRRYDSILITVANPRPIWGLIDLRAGFEIFA